MGGAVNVSKRNSSSIISPKFVGFNVAVFITFAFGYLLLVLLMMFLGGAGSTTTTTTSTTGGGLSGIMAGGSGALLGVALLTAGLSPFIALISGLFTGIGTRAMKTAAVTGLLGGFLGFLLVSIVMIGLAKLLLGASMNEIAMLGMLLFAIAVVNGITGAISSSVSYHYQ